MISCFFERFPCRLVWGSRAELAILPEEIPRTLLQTPTSQRSKSLKFLVMAAWKSRCASGRCHLAVWATKARRGSPGTPVAFPMRRTKIGFPISHVLISSVSPLWASRRSVISRSAPSVSSARFQSGVQTLLRILALLRDIPPTSSVGCYRPLWESVSKSSDWCHLQLKKQLEGIERLKRGLHMLPGSVIDVPPEHLRSGADMLSARAGRRQFGTLASSLRAFGASVASSSSADRRLCRPRRHTRVVHVITCC